MFTPLATGYDRAITIFSPEGRLFQVEYATEAVRKGMPAIGVISKEGVILMAVLPESSPIAIPLNKIYQIDEHIGLAFSGLPSDARILIEKARVEAQTNRLIYDEPISVEALTRVIADYKQLYTQHAGVRPFGVAFIIGGVDQSGPRLFGTDPSGAYREYYAHVIGRGEVEAQKFLEKHYKKGISLDEALVLAIKALMVALEEKAEGGKKQIKPSELEACIIDVKTRRFRRLSVEELKPYYEKASKIEG